MVCGTTLIFAKIAVIVMTVSVIASTVAIFTPYWNETTTTDGTKIYSGLVVQCNNTLGYCVSIQDILDRYKDLADSDWRTQVASLSLAMTGWVFSVAALVIVIVYSCLPNKITGVVAIILSFLGGGCICAAVILYGVGFKDLSSTKLGWSYGLDGAAGVLALAVGIILIVNECVIP